MKEVEVYKVVAKRLTPGKFFSARATMRFNIDYALNYTSYPVFGKIFCFDTFENALKFKQLSEVLLVGIGTNPSKPRYICSNTIDILDFWHLKNNHKSVSEISNIPIVGTILVDSFTPEKIVS